MHSDLQTHLMQANVEARAARHIEIAPAETTPRDEPVLVLRRATPADAQALRDLAELDSTELLGEDVLIALLDDEPIAALALTDGHAAADPFRRSVHAVTLLRMRAQHLTREFPRKHTAGHRVLHALRG